MHKSLTHPAAAVTAIAMLSTLAACGSSSTKHAATATSPAPATSSSPAAGSSGALQVTETEFELTPKNHAAKAGKLRITVANKGHETHALSIEGANGKGKDAESGSIQPGQTRTMTVTLKPGTYEWYCPVDDHKKEGMVGSLTVAR